MGSESADFKDTFLFYSFAALRTFFFVYKPVPIEEKFQKT